MKYTCTVHRKARLCLLCCRWYSFVAGHFCECMMTHLIRKRDPPVNLPAYSLGTLLPRGPPSCNGVVQWRKNLAGRGEQPQLKGPLSKKKTSTSPNSLQLHSHYFHIISSIQQQGSQKVRSSMACPFFYKSSHR